MEAVSVVPMDVLLAKRVQEMVANGEDPPQPYICRDDDDSEDFSFSSSAVCPVPIIDLSLFSSPAPETTGKELQKLKSALSSWGCFQAVGHGMSTSFLDEIRQVSKEFFEQPPEDKKKIAKGVEEFEGYGADPTPEKGQYLDWSDRLFLDVYPEDLRKYQFWPEAPNSFRDVLENYIIEMKTVTETISKAMAKSLNLKENCFLDQFGERGTLQARFNYYSRCPRPDIVLGLKPHADGSGYTILLQNEVDGLQILKDDCWLTIPTISDALLVLMGDQMEIMSNGIFKSPVHRVLASSERERVSVAVFYTPESGKLIGPEEDLVDEERQRLFKKVKDYADIHWKYYQQGQRALHIAKA